MTERPPEQAATTRLVAAALVLGALVLAAAQALALALDEPMVTFTRDLQRTAGVAWYAGAVSVFTNQIWLAAGVASFLVAWLVPAERRPLVALGVLALVFGLDDSLLLHEAAEQSGIPQALFYVPYAGATLLLALMMLRRSHRGMAAAFVPRRRAPGGLGVDGPGRARPAPLLGRREAPRRARLADRPGHRLRAVASPRGDALLAASTPRRRATVVAGGAAAALVILAGAVVWWTRGDRTGSGDHPVVPAAGETEPMPHERDSADDAAIWVNPDDAAASTIIGTDKRGGIAVYDLAGDELQYLPHGNFNNVDLRDDFPLGGESTTVVAATDRSDDTLALYRIDPRTGTLRDVAARIIDVGITIYGLCLYRDGAGETYAFVNSKAGDLQQWWLLDDGAGFVDAELVRSFDAGGQLEGCVADDDLDRLYLGEEDVGIWAYDAAPDGGEAGTLIAEVADDGPLVADVEGLSIAYGGDGSGYLVASSQGNDTYVVYDRASPHDHVWTFAVGAGSGTDAVSQTDGIDLTTTGLGRDFPAGLLVVHDGDNGDENQNFKLVSWDAIAEELETAGATPP